MSWGRGIGPISQAVSVAKAARVAGVNAAIACKPSFGPLVESNGVELVELLPERDVREVNGEFFNDFAAFQGLDDESFVDSTLKAETIAIERYKPDVLLSVMQFTAVLSARIHGLPLVASAKWSEHPSFAPEDPPSKATPVFNARLRAVGVDSVRDVWDLSFFRADASYVQGFAALEPKMPESATLRFVGCLDGFNMISRSLSAADGPLVEWRRWTGRKALVYLSRKDVDVERVWPAMRNLAASGIGVLVIYGASSSKENQTVPQLWATRWVDFDSEITNADIVICVGTRGVALKTLRAGKALVILNSADDELAYNSSRLSELGLAACVDVDSDFEWRLLRAVESSLSLALSPAALAVALELARSSGAAGVIDLLRSIRGTRCTT